MKPKRIFAVFKRQIWDMGSNVGVIIQYTLFPLMLLIMVLLMPNMSAMQRVSNTISTTSTFIGLIPMINILNIMLEDKRTNSLGTLIMAGVMPFEYLIGVSMFIILLAIIGSACMGLIGGLLGLRLLWFVLVASLGTIISLIIGAVISMKISSYGQMRIAMLAITLINVVITFLPSSQKPLNYLYHNQIISAMGDVFGNFFNPSRFIVLGVWIVISTLLLLLVFRNKKNIFYQHQ